MASISVMLDRDGNECKIKDAEARELISTKLTAPSTGIVVGKYFRVASLDSDSKPVLEACDLPVASSTQKGILQSGYYSFSIDQNGRAYCSTKTLSAYNSASDAEFIGKGTLENVLSDMRTKVSTLYSDYLSASEVLG